MINVHEKLWRTVIAQALGDAKGAVSDLTTPQLRTSAMASAREWFTDAGPDFRAACEFAGLEPWQVRAHALAEIARADATVKPPRPGRKPPPTDEERRARQREDARRHRERFIAKHGIEALRAKQRENVRRQRERASGTGEGLWAPEGVPVPA